jgi:hypothetical protein
MKRPPQAPYINMMKALGWKRAGGDGRTSQLTMKLEDRTIVLFCMFTMVSGTLRFMSEPQVTFEGFRSACLYVSRSVLALGSLYRPTPWSVNYVTDRPDEAFFKYHSDQLIAWAKAVDPQKALAEMALPHPDFRNGSFHVTAVALMGQVELLKYYIRLREREKAAGVLLQDPSSMEPYLSPSCTTEEILRALEIAEGRHPTLKPGMEIAPHPARQILNSL